MNKERKDIAGHGSGISGRNVIASHVASISQLLCKVFAIQSTRDRGGFVMAVLRTETLRFDHGDVQTVVPHEQRHVAKVRIDSRRRRK